VDELVIFLVLITAVLAVGALAVAGSRKARSMSKGHVDQLTQSGQAERLSHPSTRQDYFLRPMSPWDVLLGVLGALCLIVGLRVLRTWLGW
jgi:hypothetical protein